MSDKIWDKCILTATNEKQALVYRFQLQRLKKVGLIHPDTECFVIPDPNGVRIGSGGATLHVLRLMKKIGQVTNGKDFRLLILHSGGDSRRIPHQSILGKVFAPLPPPMHSIFEVMYNFLTPIGAQIDAGMVVACGDTWMRLNASRSDTDVISLPDGYDVTGIAYQGSLELGSRHGVYDIIPNTHEVRRYVQKHPVERLRDEGFCSPDGRVAVDTGILLFQPAAVKKLLTLTRELAEDAFVDLYADMLPAMATQVDHHFIHKLPVVRQLLRKTFSNLRCGVSCPPLLEFIHTGTTKEYLELIKHPINSNTSISGQVPLNEERWVNLTYGATDIPTTFGDDATLFGKSILQWLQEHELTPDVIWHKEQVANASQQCLWNARLYPIYSTNDPNITFDISIDDLVKYPTWFQNPGEEWQNSERLSMRDIMERANRVKAFVQQQQMEAEKIVESIVEMVEMESDIGDHPLLREILTPFGYEKAIAIFDEAIKHIGNPLLRARLHKIAADLCTPFIETSPLTEQVPFSLLMEKFPGLIDIEKKHDYHYAQAFAAVREAKLKSIVNHQ